MKCSLCHRREVEYFEHTKLPLRPKLCGPCYSRERAAYYRREKTAKSLPTLVGKSFREVFGKEPSDRSFWL
jgi:hypothetical protein